MIGWSCPHCGKAHAPSVLTCPEPARLAPAWPQPLTPAPWPQPDAPWIVTCQSVTGAAGDFQSYNGTAQ